MFGQLNSDFFLLHGSETLDLKKKRNRELIDVSRELLIKLEMLVCLIWGLRTLSILHTQVEVCAIVIPVKFEITYALALCALATLVRRLRAGLASESSG